MLVGKHTLHPIPLSLRLSKIIYKAGLLDKLKLMKVAVLLIGNKLALDYGQVSLKLVSVIMLNQNNLQPIQINVALTNQILVKQQLELIHNNLPDGLKIRYFVSKNPISNTLLTVIVSLAILNVQHKYVLSKASCARLQISISQ